MSDKIEGITITIDGTNTTDNINDYNKCLKCGSHEHSRFYLDNGTLIVNCDECGFRVEGFGTPPSVAIDNGQFCAIYSYIQQLELCLIGAGSQMPSNRKHINWNQFDNDYHKACSNDVYD